MTTLAEVITQLQTDDAELTADVAAVTAALAANANAITALQAQIDSGTLGIDNQNALEGVINDLNAAHATLTAALAPPTPAPAG